jgi:ATP-dependent Lon protease
MAKKKSTNLAQTEAIKTRAGMAAELEKERLELTKEIEKLMKQYAKATGLRKLARRKAKVGKAPNDFKA